MPRQIVINLPAANVPQSQTFFESLGFSCDPQVAGDSAARMILSETISIMLLDQQMFSNFSPKPICEPSTAEALLCLSCESRAEVDEMISKARDAGGTIYEEAVDYGFMYHSSFGDLDGHLWALNCMA